MKFKTIVGTVTLTVERKIHIIQRHPIMDNYLVRIKEVLEVPDETRYSHYSDTILLFYRYFDNIEGGKYIAVVVNIKDLQVKTAYLTNRIKSGRKYVKEKF
ncbi:hypothetical protein A3F00_02860 [Candidatus Daviesbacteria bacterium RIFCSPHIGHO2_12_FULL_37_11]|uniref:Phage-Barnase-EndoU-ColicinE5/D-RelE like nuclease 3 domain-containing protein n=1 Tax=Candidatus Daviesbacteria bacterium RIFCSPHIGHO2_12_FULL_37_11 TaxID=1797777 RepID=A0A1F5KC90_9BACT|nr:MAG: hypothetical protein A2769_04150 [Candidatus Daviesbacteria bacterium RIFCSPHIGHO2_01_FULL_37_27]OGE38241.1 MAG: hypothetical protein A3F00_02860 [Candidatus Daviesbacteria bacterium RIFCSPHIGHO2_12_FULL_37_11]OGE46198.1 MAG: hypothetical protein A3B39_02625 [Candidatus Daviesbacteria bacterium RIFCSPLOWO2_01_FULL_37_10]